MTSCGASVLKRDRFAEARRRAAADRDDAIRVVLVEDRERLFRHLDRRMHRRAEEVADRKLAKNAGDTPAGILLLRRRKHQRALRPKSTQNLACFGKAPRPEDHALRATLVDEGLDRARGAHRLGPEGGAQPPLRITWSLGAAGAATGPHASRSSLMAVAVFADI